MIEINPVGANLPNAFLPEGRIVAGHPMLFTQDKDDHGKPALRADGSPKMSCYFGFAIPKAGEQHWNQTQWGQLIWNEGMAGFPRGEFNAPTFAWKIVDGDSRVPNKAGKIPAEQEGYAGHWILNISTSLSAPKCYKLNPQMGTLQELINDKEMKKGDYGRVSLTVKANCDAQGFAKSPGVYLNPAAFCLDREGQEIVSEGAVRVDAAAAFGGTVAAPTPAPVAPPPPPAAEASWMNPPAPAAERTYNLGGNSYTRAQLQQAGYTDAQIDALP